MSTKERKPRQAKQLNYDQLLAQTGNLTLEEKTELCKELKRQITNETQQLQTAADKAKEITKGL